MVSVEDVNEVTPVTTNVFSVVFLATPNPPKVVIAPVLTDVEFAVLGTTNNPPPPTALASQYALVTAFGELVGVGTLTVPLNVEVPWTVNPPATNILFETPMPPATDKDPVLLEVDSAALDMYISPFTDTV